MTTERFKLEERRPGDKGVLLEDADTDFRCIVDTDDVDVEQVMATARDVVEALNAAQLYVHPPTPFDEDEETGA